ncbi:MAG: adenylyltransferase/cytidyltransferase family protein [Magnetococcales bacterium]|nr:adenylyltransferase/cytidyltransferase family protein [Magnetococcales bacterium]
MDAKILSLEQMAAKAAALKAGGQRLVLCHGTFDLMHLGHIRHLQRARAEGDCLLVTLTADRFVSKGPGRPVFTEMLRAESLASLACVGYVAVVPEATAISAILAIRPDVYVKGQDYQNGEQDITGNIVLERNAVEGVGGRIFFTDEITFSSTNLLNDHFDVFSPLTREYLRDFKKRYTGDRLVELVQGLSGLKVLVVGDAIVDEYCYTKPLGLTGKSGNILATRFNTTEQFAGGSLAIANHLAEFCRGVTLAAGLGMDDRHEPFIRSKLSRGVSPVFFYFENAPTLVKRRFVDEEMNKLFEVYYYDPQPLSPGLEEIICNWLRKNLPLYDAVVVPDYGNGFISKTMVEVLVEGAKYLAVNAQINSGNRGYHAITQYPRADFVSLNEPEVRLAGHNRHDPIEVVATGLGRRIGADHFAITQGVQGATMLDLSGGRSWLVPALSTKVVDRIGAGDAFLSLAGLSLAGGLDGEVAAFVGSAAAALDVQIVCNRGHVTPVGLYKYLTTLLK